ncbi:hypothetical protein SODG_001325 [Sodalis praecaptivus]
MAGSGSVRDQRNACVVGRISAINRPVLLGLRGSASNITRQNRLLACCGMMVSHKQRRRGSRHRSQRSTRQPRARKGRVECCKRKWRKASTAFKVMAWPAVEKEDEFTGALKGRVMLFASRPGFSGRISLFAQGGLLAA